MNNETITINGREYAFSHFSAKVGIKELVDHYHDTEKFITYCKKCNKYNACWACPPFDFDADEYLMSCKIAYIIGTKIEIDKEVVNHYQGWDNCTKISYEIIEEIRKKLDKRLLNLEEQYPASRAFFAGTCHICQAGKCTRITGEPCLFPTRIRPSLEALGFDVSKISSDLLNTEMKWSINGILPEYFTLVSGFFTDNENLLIF